MKCVFNSWNSFFILIFIFSMCSKSHNNDGTDIETIDESTNNDINYEDINYEDINYEDINLQDNFSQDIEQDAGAYLCQQDEDCVIALDQNRCCNPDPVAVTKLELQNNPCLNELGQEWIDNPQCQQIDCFACSPITHRAYGARCDNGTCIAIEDYCPPEITAPVPEVTLEAGVTPEGGWEQYRGQFIELFGRPNLNTKNLSDGTCMCSQTNDQCSCYDVPVQLTLDCDISIFGSICGSSYGCSGTECSPQCFPYINIYDPRHNYMLDLTGYLVDSYSGFELWVASSKSDCYPYGINHEGETCEAFSTQPEDYQCDNGLYCIFFGDVLFGCDGICKPQGDECVDESNCGDNEICQHGYCGFAGG